MIVDAVSSRHQSLLLRSAKVQNLVFLRRFSCGFGCKLFNARVASSYQSQTVFHSSLLTSYLSPLTSYFSRFQLLRSQRTNAVAATPRCDLLRSSVESSFLNPQAPIASLSVIAIRLRLGYGATGFVKSSFPLSVGISMCKGVVTDRWRRQEPSPRLRRGKLCRPTARARAFPRRCRRSIR